jgi:hypothetical protein
MKPNALESGFPCPVVNSNLMPNLPDPPSHSPTFELSPIFNLPTAPCHLPLEASEPDTSSPSLDSPNFQHAAAMERYGFLAFF